MDELYSSHQPDPYAAPPQPSRQHPHSDLLPDPSLQQQMPPSQLFQQTSGLQQTNYQSYPPPPPQPPRPQPTTGVLPDPSLQQQVPASQLFQQTSTYEQPPPQPPRPQQHLEAIGGTSTHSAYVPQLHQGGYVPPPPPQRLGPDFGDDDPSSPVHYTRDPHKLIAYLVPFPKPRVQGVDPANIPDRFLIYTPPPPPLGKPIEGEKEAKLHKVQRKWQEEVRAAKTSTAKTASWKGVKSKATRGINKAMAYTTTSNLDFLGRATGGKSDSEDDGVHEGETTHKTVAVEEMVLVHPPMGMSQDEMRTEFVNTMLRAKTKAQRDAVISTGLMPVAYGIDILATFVWPFGGLGEIDTVWAYSTIRGAKTARSVTKRLSSSSTTGDHENDKLHLRFEPSQRIEVLRRYLAADCNKTDPKVFPEYTSAPTETDVLEAIGWNPHQSGGEDKNWEDEQWQMTEVKEDVRLVMHKGAKEWDKWCKLYAKDPEKAMKK